MSFRASYSSENLSRIEDGFGVPEKFKHLDHLNRHTSPPSVVLGSRKGRFDLNLPSTNVGDIWNIVPVLTQKDRVEYSKPSNRWSKLNPLTPNKIRLSLPASASGLFDAGGSASFGLKAVIKGDRNTSWYVVPSMAWSKSGCDVSISYRAENRTWNEITAQDRRGEAFSSGFGEVSNGYTPGKPRSYPYERFGNCRVYLFEDPKSAIPLLPGDILEFKTNPGGDSRDAKYTQIRF